MDGQLAEVQRQFDAGRFDDAEAACRKFLEDTPHHAEALTLLGRVQCQRGEFLQAATSIGTAIKLQPTDGKLRRYLGYIHFLAGNEEGSIDSYRHALQLDPKDAETWNNLGLTLRHMGRLDQAVAALQEAVRLRSDLALPCKNLGEVLRLQGKLALANSHYEHAIRLDPGDAESRNGLGVVLSMQGRHAEAIANFEEALTLRSDYAEAENNLATILATVGRLDEALAHGRNALRLRPRFSNAHVTVGNVLKLQRKIDHAMEEYRQALELDRNNAVAHQSLGNALTDLGKFDVAAAHLEEALRLKPNFVVAWQNLAALAIHDNYPISSQKLDGLQKLLDGGCLAADDVARLHFTMGSILDKRGQYDEAMRSYRKANDFQLRMLKTAGFAFDGDQFRSQIDKIISVFGPDVFERFGLAGLDSQTPVFVVGMPRSGTTLVEQIIASHPQAGGAGELPDIRKLTEKLQDLVGGNAPYPQCINRADPASIASLGQAYLDRLAAYAPGAMRVIDKLPGNFLHLGFISILFPNARVIHCRRDAMDICLSCYFCDFRVMHWAWRLTDIGLYYQQYERLMAHWRRVLPLSVYEVNYEQLVANQEAVSRELLDFCGLDWNDQCLEFYKTDHVVQTLSRVQVRQPIYGSSVGRWKKYSKHLAPLAEALGREEVSARSIEQEPDGS